MTICSTTDAQNLVTLLEKVVYIENNDFKQEPNYVFCMDTGNKTWRINIRK